MSGSPMFLAVIALAYAASCATTTSVVGKTPLAENPVPPDELCPTVDALIEAGQAMGLYRDNDPYADASMECWDLSLVRSVGGHEQDYHFVLNSVVDAGNLPPVVLTSQRWRDGTVPNDAERQKSAEERKVLSKELWAKAMAKLHPTPPPPPPATAAETVEEAPTVAAPHADSSPSGESVALMPLKGRGIPDGTVEILDELLAAEVTAVAPHKVITMQDISAMLGREQLKDSLGCDDVACAAEIGGALGTRYLVAGSVNKLGTKIILSLTVIDTSRQEVQNRVKRSVVNDENKYEAMLKAAAGELF